PRVDAFLNSCSTFALNIWMALAASCLTCADGVPGSTIVTHAGANGVRFGVQLAAAPGRWITIPAPVPRGILDSAHGNRIAARALGDSAVVDFFGLGAQSLTKTSAAYVLLQKFLPADALQRGEQFLCGNLPGLLGRRAAVDARTVASIRRGPLVLLG